MAQQNSLGSEHALHPTEQPKELTADQSGYSANHSANHSAKRNNLNGSSNQNDVCPARLVVDLEPGHRALAQGDVAAAIHQYQQVLDTHPNSPEVYQALAEAFSFQGQLAESAACYRKAIELLAQPKTQPDPTPSTGVQPTRTEIVVDVEELCTLLQAAEAACADRQWQTVRQRCQQLLDLQPSARAHKLMGNVLQASGEIEAAMQSYRAALHLQPDWAEVQANLGSLHAQQQQWSAAIAAYEQALHLKPNFAGAYRNLARIWTQLGQPEQATHCWYQALRLEPDDAHIHQQFNVALVPPLHSAAKWADLGAFYAEQQQWNKAVAAYRTALSLDADLPQIEQQLGHALKQQGEALLAEAWNCYRHAIQRDPDDLQNYHAAIDLNPDEPSLYHALAEALERQGDRAGAITFRQVAEQLLSASDHESLNPQPVVIPIERDRLSTRSASAVEPVQLDQSSDHEAKPCIQEAAVQLQRGKALQQQGHLDEAIEAYRQATQLNPQAAEGFHQLGNVWLKQQQWSSAAEAYQQAIQLNPQDGWSHQGLADAAMQLEQWETAAGAYQRAAELNPTFFWSHQGLADACMKRERWNEAATAYQQAIQQKDDFYWSHYNLGEAWAKLERWDEAVAAFRRALALEPSGLGYQKLGDALQQQTEPDLAAALNCYQQAIAADPHDLLNYHKAIELQPQNSQLYGQLANALQQQNQGQQAILFYQMALQLNPTDAALQRSLAELTQTITNSVALPESNQANGRTNFRMNAKINTKINGKINRRTNGKIYPTTATRPKFSVVVPIYDRTQLLYEALTSICRQTCTDFEVLLVLDGSPQATIEVAQQFLDDPRFRMYAYPEASGNACRGRNRGILEASGDYIALLDSDDLATPDRLAVTLAAFEQHDCEAVVGKAQYLILEHRPNVSVQTLSENQVVPLIYPVLKRVNPIVTSTISIRRDVLLKYGGFRPEMRYREDHELWLRLVYHGCRMVFVDHRFAQYRLHQTNNELNFKAQDRQWIDLMHQSYRQPFSHWGV